MAYAFHSSHATNLHDAVICMSYIVHIHVHVHSQLIIDAITRRNLSLYVCSSYCNSYMY